MRKNQLYCCTNCRTLAWQSRTGFVAKQRNRRLAQQLIDYTPAPRPEGQSPNDT